MANNLFYQDVVLNTRAVNDEERSVEVSFSSEAPIPRGGVPEVLLHGNDNVDLSYLKNMGAVLLNHNKDVIVGRIENPRIEGKKGRAKIYFDDDEEGNRAFRKVKSGSLRGISVGAKLNRIRVVMPGEQYEGIEGPADVATRWTPHEISLTPIPADGTVGVDRMRSLDGIEIENESKTHKEKHTMDEKDVQRIVQDALTAEREKTAEMVAKVVRETIEDDNKPKMRIAPEKGQALLGRAGAVSPELKNEVADMIFEGRTEEEVQNKIFDSVTGKGDSTRSDKGAGGEGTTTDDNNKRTIDQIDDEIFSRSLSNMG